jgi:UDP-N-acetylmuramate dehydrogenase
MLINENISLKPFNTFGIDALARYYTEARSLELIQEILQSDIAKNNPILVLGGGSNLLLTKDVDALVIKNQLKGIQLIHEDEEHYFVKAAAGENWHSFVMYCIGKGYGGVENLALIPGNVGASPMQNIGAYGVEIKDVFESLEAIHLTTGELIRFNQSDCAFGYRESIFKNKYKNQLIITSVTYRLKKIHSFNIAYGAIREELDRMQINSLSIAAIADAVIRIRQSKLPDPAILGNAGSFFKNPEVAAETFGKLKADHSGMVGFPLTDGKVKLAAGWMIEQCGWKGFRRGDAGCHIHQALVLVNYGNASGAEIYSLSEEIIQSVVKKYGVVLEREVNII